MFKDADFSTSGVHYDSCCWLSRCNVAVMLLNLFLPQILSKVAFIETSHMYLNKHRVDTKHP